ncbi:MAG TPA: M24 family metallopeptidase [Stellaceae bacterium]|jgi:Xaa-Pro aminopeptidase|nr:M24 family metallopeptidase [Stellaceae bacterium]
MLETNGRLNTPISTPELTRRWSAVRKAMDNRKIDVLVMQNNNDHMGGYVKYFTDIPAGNGYPLTVCFPKDDGMTVVNQGPFGLNRTLPPEGDEQFRGVKRVFGTPSYASCDYTIDYDAELAVKGLSPHGTGTIGIVGRGTLPMAMVDAIRKHYPQAKLVNATDMVDQIKCVKSAEEIALARRTAAIQDAAIDAAMKAAAPGKKDIEIGALAEEVILDLGGEQGIYLCSSYKPGAPSGHVPRHNQQRVMREGDVYTLLVETNGPGGFYTEISRTIVLGKASQEMKDEFAFVLEARKFALSLLKPGAACKDIWNAYNQFMREHGRPEEQRLFFHGQGYDLVERPLVRVDEPMPIQANMWFACHPTYMTKNLFATYCDDFLVTEAGVERLHKYPEQIFELG